MSVQEQFTNACEGGDLEKAKELLENNPNINISAENEQAFRWACYNGQLHVAKWLLSLKNIDISTENELAFRWACYNGHLHVVQWLLSLKNINISAENEYAFRWACYNEQLHVAQRLISIQHINISAHNEWTFTSVCRDRRINSAKWLQTLLPFKYGIVAENNTIVSWKIRNKPEEYLLRMLYAFTKNGYAHNLNAGFVLMCVNMFA